MEPAHNRLSNSTERIDGTLANPATHVPQQWSYQQPKSSTTTDNTTSIGTSTVATAKTYNAPSSSQTTGQRSDLMQTSTSAQPPFDHSGSAAPWAYDWARTGISCSLSLPGLCLSSTRSPALPSLTPLTWACVYMATKCWGHRKCSDSATPQIDGKQQPSNQITFAFNATQLDGLFYAAKTYMRPHSVLCSVDSVVPGLTNALNHLVSNTKIHSALELRALVQHTLLFSAGIAMRNSSTLVDRPALQSEWQPSTQNSSSDDDYCMASASIATELSKIVHGTGLASESLLQDLQHNLEDCHPDLFLIARDQPLWMMDVRLPSDLTDDDLERFVNLLRNDGAVIMCASEPVTSHKEIEVAKLGMNFATPASAHRKASLGSAMRRMLPLVSVSYELLLTGKLVQRMIMNRCPRMVLHNWNRAVLFHLDSELVVHVSPCVSRESLSSNDYSMLDLFLALEIHAKNFGKSAPMSPTVYADDAASVFDKVLGKPAPECFTELVGRCSVLRQCDGEGSETSTVASTGSYCF